MESINLMSEPSQPRMILRVGSGIFYCAASFSIILLNKIILTSFKFPSFEVLGVGQIFTSVVVLLIAKLFKLVEFPPISISVFKQIWPLPLFYFGNLTFGLGGTQKISLPMFTALRRFSILFTMIAEKLVLGIVATLTVKLSVATMVGGALVAAVNDLSFDVTGYTFIFMNDICTAVNNVYVKQTLEAKSVGKFGLIFYNCLVILIPLTLYALASGGFSQVQTFTEWSNPYFVVCFVGSCFMGFILNYAVVLCTFYNSALTTTIMGVIKNLAVTYIGMVVGGDYVFSLVNFIGLNISVLGSIIYTYATFKPKKPHVVSINNPIIIIDSGNK